MATKVSITTGEQPVDICVEQPGEAPHTRSVAPQSGYDFEIAGQATVEIGGDATVNRAEEPVPAVEPEAPVDEPVPAEEPADPESDDPHIRKPRKR